nr:olfactory receptor class A-like protein 1 [Nothobranchius furzeri]
MLSEVGVRGTLYLSLTVVGVPGNTAVIAAFLHLIYEDTGLLTADAIVLHLACVNLLVVTVRCLLETIASFSLTNVFGDVGCKAVIFIYRTSRALSIWLTFLLSAYQCLSITPPGSRWAFVRALVAQNLVFVFLFLWVLNTSLSAGAIMFSVSSSNGSNLTRSAINAQFCYVNFPTEQLKETYGALQVSRDAVPMALMTLASLMILLLLYKHSQQMKGLSSSSGGGAGGGGAKQRAAKVVVVLVTMYVVLYGVDNGLWVYTLTLKQTMTSSLISDLRVFFASLYAALSPLIIIVSNRKVNSTLRCVRQARPVVGKTSCLSAV